MKHCEAKRFFFIENANIDESGLNNNKLHLNKKGTIILTQNIKRSFNQFWSSDGQTHEVDVTNSNLIENRDIDQVLKALRNDNTSNLNFCYLNININLVRNKLPYLQTIINRNTDIVATAETKLDASFLSSQFILEGYYIPYCLDINNKSGGMLVYVKHPVPSRCLSCEELFASMEAIPFEINSRKEKWLVISFYRPHLQNSEYFLNFFTKIIEFFALWNIHLILGDFNLEPTDSAPMIFLDSNSITSFIKTNTRFTGFLHNLILTNRNLNSTICFNIWNPN